MTVSRINPTSVGKLEFLTEVISSKDGINPTSVGKLSRGGYWDCSGRRDQPHKCGETQLCLPVLPWDAKDQPHKCGETTRFFARSRD